MMHWVAWLATASSAWRPQPEQKSWSGMCLCGNEGWVPVGAPLFVGGDEGVGEALGCSAAGLD